MGFWDTVGDGFASTFTFNQCDDSGCGGSHTGSNSVYNAISSTATKVYNTGKAIIDPSSSPNTSTPLNVAKIAEWGLIGLVGVTGCMLLMRLL